MPTYISYKGSPDVFEQETGKYISFEEAQKLGNVFGNVKQSDALRPGVTQESDFAKLSQTNLPSYNPIASPQNQPSPEAQKLFSQGAVPISKTPQEIQREQENTATRKRFLDIQEQFLASLTPSPEEQQLTADYLSKKREATGALVGAQEDIAGIEGRPSTMGLITGATQARQKQYELQKMRIALEMQPMVDRLNTLSTQRGQVQDKAKLMLQLMQATQPEIKKVDIADDGTVTAIYTDPFTGETSLKNIGSVPREAKKIDYITKSTRVDQDGQLVFHGLKSDGSVDTIPMSEPGQFRVVGGGEDGTSDDITSYAQRLNAGQITASNVPQKIRGQVLTEAKRLAETDLEEDIKIGDQQGLTREQLQDKLATAYPEFTKQEIHNKVYALIPDKPAQEEGGTEDSFFKRLLGF